MPRCIDRARCFPGGTAARRAAPDSSRPTLPAIPTLESRLLLSAGTSITEFHLPTDPTRHYDPAWMAAGPDGNLWFGGAGPPFTVFRMTTAGVFSAFDVPKIRQGISENSYGAFAAGPDGNVWFGNQ